MDTPKGTVVSVMTRGDRFVATVNVDVSAVCARCAAGRGCGAGLLIGLCTEYFTSSHYAPTKKIAGSAITGPATLMIEGLSVGMFSTAFPMIIVSCAIIASFFFAGGFENFSLGL